MSKIVIAYDDDPGMRKQLERVFFSIKTYYHLEASFPNPSRILEQVASYKPDVVLLDIDMRDNEDDGLIALYEIKRNDPEQKVMMLTTFDHDEKIFNAICLGADGYMLKTDFVDNMPHEVMRRSLNIIFSDGAYLTPAVAKKILYLFRNPGIGLRAEKIVDRFKNLFTQSKNTTASKMKYNLKPIQIEILELLVAGKTTPQIAEEKGMPENTVNHHIKGIYRELEIHGRADLVRKAIQEKVIILRK